MQGREFRDYDASGPQARALQYGLDFYVAAGEAAIKEAKDLNKPFTGRPHGKRPTALFNSMLYRLAQYLDQEGMDPVLIEFRAKFPDQVDNVKAAMVALCEIGAAAVKKHTRTTRCFKVDISMPVKEEEQDGVKWIFGTPCVTTFGHLQVLRESDVLKPSGVELCYDFGPRSNAAKEVQKIAFGQKGEGKGKGQNKNKDAN